MSRTPALIAIAAVLALLVGSVAVWVPRQGAGSPASPEARSASSRDGGGAALRLAEPSLDGACRREPPAVLREPDRAAVEETIAELALVLARPGTTRHEWERALGAVAGGLGSAVLPRVHEICAGDRRAEVRLAAIELARRLSESDPEGEARLPAPARAWLGGLLGREDLPPAMEAAACRSMVVFGGRDERLALVGRLAACPRDQARTAAAWGLEAARDAATLLALADSLAAGADPRGSDLAAATIDAILRSVEPGNVDPRAAYVLESRLVSVLEDGGGGASLRRRSVLALGRLGGATVEASFARVFADGGEDTEVRGAVAHAMARMAGGEGLRTLAGMLSDGAADPHARFLAAEALVASDQPEELGPAMLSMANEHLCGAAERDPRPSARRRALLALARSPDPRVLPAIAGCARSDDDPTVRAAARLALERIGRAAE